MQQADRLSPEDVRTVMLTMPFRKFEQRKYLSYDRQNLACIRFQVALWRQIAPDDLTALRSRCEQSISEYYERIGS